MRHPQNTHAYQSVQRSIIMQRHPIIMHGHPIIMHGNPIIMHRHPIIMHRHPIFMHRNPRIMHMHLVRCTVSGPTPPTMCCGLAALDSGPVSAAVSTCCFCHCPLICHCLLPCRFLSSQTLASILPHLNLHLHLLGCLLRRL